MASDGDYHPASKTCLYRGKMADLMDKGNDPIREAVRVIDADLHVMKTHAPDDGKEVITMMTEPSRTALQASHG